MKRIHFVSLGCPKNRVDSEVMVGKLQRGPFEMVDDPAAADVIVVNTCSFIQPATEESIDTVLAMSGYKQAGSCKKLVVTGCMVQRYGRSLEEELPEGAQAAQSKAELWDLVRPLEGDCTLQLLKFEDKEGKMVFWHSSAHVLGECMECKYGAKLCIGPPTEEGFYYDAYMGTRCVSAASPSPCPSPSAS
jgi:hypothetical protein